MDKTPSEDILRKRVGRDIRRMILSGELQPGERLAQQRLAKQFGVSQSVLRESLLELQFTGLVQSVDSLGMFVAAIDVSQLLQAYSVREMLEGLAARLCCDRASVADVREFTATAQKIHELGIGGQDSERADLDRRFHERTIEIAGNAILERVSGAYHIVRLVVVSVIPHEDVLSQHLAIVKAIEANNPEEAERAARHHVRSARHMIEQQIANSDFVFPHRPQ
jgi:DNA-binding GntR family transcriptional regulator